MTTLDSVFDLLDRLEKDAAWYDALNDYSNEFWLDYQGAKEHVRVLNLFRNSEVAGPSESRILETHYHKFTFLMKSLSRTSQLFD